MGEIKVLLEEVQRLIIETEDILKNEFDYESEMRGISIDDKSGIIVIEDKSGKVFQYDICDSYTSLIKLIKSYNNEKIVHNYKKLKEISLKAELV